jgi:lipid-binding SYLF domain-containing protein
MYSLDIGSLGPQLGTSSTDYVGLVMTDRGANKILSGRLKLGAGAQAVAGPSGAQAAGFNDPNVDVLTYSQSKGLFAGAAIGGASISSDDTANRLLYGKAIDAPTFARDPSESVPDSAKRLDEILQKATPKHLSS